MRTWRVAVGPLRCGNGGHPIRTGEPYLEYRIGAAVRLRCQSCGENMTGSPAPDAIEDEAAPPLQVPHQPSLGMEAIGAVAAKSADWRRRFRR